MNAGGGRHRREQRHDFGEQQWGGGENSVEAADIQQSGRIEADSASAAGGDVRLLAEQQLVLGSGSKLSATGATTGGFIEACCRSAWAAVYGNVDGDRLERAACRIGPAEPFPYRAIGDITIDADNFISIHSRRLSAIAPRPHPHADAGLISFEANVTGLRDLVVTAGSSIAFDAPSAPLTISTCRRQVYNAPVDILTDTMLNATGVTFASTVEAPRARVPDINGSADLRGPVGRF